MRSVCISGLTLRRRLYCMECKIRKKNKRFSHFETTYTFPHQFVFHLCINHQVLLLTFGAHRKRYERERKIKNTFLKCNWLQLNNLQSLLGITYLLVYLFIFLHLLFPSSLPPSHVWSSFQPFQRPTALSIERTCEQHTTFVTFGVEQRLNSR